MAEFTKEELIAEAKRRGLDVPKNPTSGSQFSRQELLAEAKRRGLDVPTEVGAGAQPRSGLEQRLGPLEKRTGAQQAVSDVFSGFNRGAAQLAGLPVDIASAGLRAAGVDVGGNPALGSKHLISLMEKISAIQPPRSITGRRVQRVTEELGASAIPGAVTAARTALREGGEAATRFAGREAVTALAAGGGAAAAQELAPGNESAEIAGLVGPSAAFGAVQAGVRGLARGGERGRQRVAQSVEQFQEAGATPTLGQATGRTSVQALENISGGLVGGVNKFRKFAEKTQEGIENRIGGIVESLAGGQAVSPERAGRVIEEGIAGFAARQRTRARALWSQVDTALPGAQQVNPNNTIRAFDELLEPIPGAQNTSDLLDNPVVKEMAERVKRDIDANNGTLPFSALRGLRSKVGRTLSKPEILSNVPRAEMKRVYAAITDDMKSALADQPAALRKFERANKFSRGMHERADKVLDRLNRKVAPEDIFFAVTQGVSGRRGGTQARRLMRGLTEKERKLVSAAAVDQLGQAKPGSVGDFSANTFLTRYRKMSEEAKNAFFGGPEMGGLKGSLDKIGASLEDIREGADVLANPSGTAGRTAAQATLGALFYGLINADLPILGGIVGGATANRMAATLMTSPKFVKWLGDSTKMSMEKLPGHIARLGTSVSQSPPEVQEAAHALVEGTQAWMEQASPLGPGIDIDD